MQLIIHIRRIGGERQRELLRSLLPVLGLLVLHAAIEVVSALLAKRAHRHSQQASDDNERDNRVPTVC